MTLSAQCLALLKVVLSTTGEFETVNGSEVPASRRLNNEESIERKKFIDVHQEVLNQIEAERKAIVEPVEAEWKTNNPNEDTKKQQADCNEYLNKNPDLIKQVSELFTKQREVALDKATKEVAKKYFVEYGDKVGWLAGDDAIVEMVAKELC